MKKKKNFFSSNLFRNISIVGLWTLASRVLGFVRDILMANFLGASAVAEAFMIAFSLPNMFRRLFAEGAFNTAFIPMFAKKVSKITSAAKFASDAFTLLLVSLLITTALAEILIPLLVFLMASGFADDVRFSDSIGFGRVMFPYIILISLSAFFGGILNTFGKFGITAAAPLSLNLFFIAALIIAYFFNLNFGWAMAFAVPLAGLFQLFLIWQALKNQTIKLSVTRPKLDGEIMKLIRIAIPAAMAGGIIQINLLVGRQVASYFDGAIAWLNYADRLYQLPLGVVGAAIGVVLLPSLSKPVAKNATSKKSNSINRSTEYALILTLPAAFALIVIPYPIVSVLFERGQFSSSDSIFTSKALFIYAVGLPAFVLQKIFSTIYFSNGDTKSPFNFALIGMLSNFIAAVGFSPVAGYLAAPIGTTFSAWLMVFLLWRKSKSFGFKFDKKFKGNLLKILFASFVLATVLKLSAFLCYDALFSENVRYFTLALIVSGGTGCYFISCHFLGLLGRTRKNR